MAKFRDEQGNITEIGSPELNPQLVQGRTRVPDTTPLGSIDSSTLTPPPSVDFKSPQDTTLFPVGSLDSTAPALEPREQEADKFSQAIASLNTNLLGESEFRSQQEQQQGISELTRAQTDLSSRLKAIQNEALAIPLQLQQEAKGRGITAGGLQPLQTARLRTNAIQALGVASLLEASRGNLSTALDLVDRAVAQKYDPIRERINVAKANLELIIESPSFKKAEKDRAQKQLDIQNKKEAEVEQQQAQEEEVKKQTLKYAGIADALTLDEMSKAESAIEVERIAAEKGLSSGQETKDFTLSKGQIRFDAKGNVIAEGVKDTTGLGGISSVEGWASLLSKGQASIANVPQNIRNQVIKHLETNEIDVGKQLSDTAIKQITQSDSAVNNLADLRKVIEENLQFVGPISGLQRFNPWSDARKAQADIDRVRQTVGKALEGGVLRKEDEEKYKKILATLSDTPETAIYKIDALVSTINRDIQKFKEGQVSAGRFVEGVSGETLSADDARSKYNY